MVLMGNTTITYMIDMLKEGKITSKSLLTIISLLFYRTEMAIIGTNSMKTIETERTGDICKNRQTNFCCR